MTAPRDSSGPRPPRRAGRWLPTVLVVVAVTALVWVVVTVVLSGQSFF